MLAHLRSLVSGITGWQLFVRLVTIAFVAMAVSRLIPAGRTAQGRRMAFLPAWGAGAVALAVVLGTAAYTLGRPVRGHDIAAVADPDVAHVAVVSSRLPAAPGSYLGVFEPGELTSYKPVSRFGAVTGRAPNIVLCYGSLQGRFPAKLAAEARSHGAIVLMQVSTGSVLMATIAAGHFDAYLRAYAGQVRAFGHQVIISFAPEMNGDWYPWGYKHTRPTVWIAAWRHVVRVFRAAGARNVTWLWTVNRESGSTGPVRDWWPGGSYVTWVGIDGYYFRRTDTFSTVFQQAISQVRAVTRDPILLSETAVGPVAGAAKIPGLFAGFRRDRLLGLVWFDQDQHGHLFHQNWRLEDHPAALAAFRSAVRRYL